MGDIIFKSTNNAPRQAALLVVSVMFILVDIVFLLVEPSVNLMWVLVLSFIFFFAANYFAGMVYAVTIEDDLVVAKNLWRKRQFAKSELEDIVRVNWGVYYPLNPYIRFKFSSNRSIVTTMPNQLKVFFADGGIKKYLVNLKGRILTF